MHFGFKFSPGATGQSMGSIRAKTEHVHATAHSSHACGTPVLQSCYWASNVVRNARKAQVPEPGWRILDMCTRRFRKNRGTTGKQDRHTQARLGLALAMPAPSRGIGQKDFWGMQIVPNYIGTFAGCAARVQKFKTTPKAHV